MQQHNLTQAAGQLADMMRLGGAKVRVGDVLSALEPLGLTLARANPDDTTRLEDLFEANTETRPCACDGGDWMRRTDDGVSDVGGGWWHYDDEGYVTRKCPDGNRKPAQ